MQPEVFYWEPPNEKAGTSLTNRAELYDAVDLIWCNRVGEKHNINMDLRRIQARTLMMHITNDNWLNFKLAEKAVDNIPGADLISEESPVAPYGVFPIINHRKNDPKFVDAGYFGAWFGGISSDANYICDNVGAKPRARLKINLGEFRPVQQHDLALGLAQKAKNALALQHRQGA